MAKRAVLVVSAWPPAIGGAAVFAERLHSDARANEYAKLIKFNNLKRPSPSYRSDLSWNWSVLAPVVRLLSAAWNLVRYIAALLVKRPDLVQVHYNGRFDGGQLVELCSYLAVARAFRCRVLTRHGGRFHPHLGERRPWERHLLRRCFFSIPEVTFVQWPGLRDSYLEMARGLGRSPVIRVLPNTIDATEFRPRSGAASPSSVPRVGFIAGPDPHRKGVFDLLDVVRQMSDAERTRFQLCCIGEHPEAEAAIRQMNQAGFSIERLGFVFGQEKVEWYRGLDIFVLPTYREGFPNSLLEAMASGVATITTPVDAIPWIVSDGFDGTLVEPGDKAALKDSLLELVGNASKRSRLGLAARETVLSRFDLHGPWIEPLLEAYRA